MARPDFSDPASVVRSFIHQMHCWEAVAAALQGSAEARFNAGDGEMHSEEERAAEVVKQIPPLIAAIYLTERDREQALSCSYSEPPQFDPGTEKVTRVIPKTKSQVIVETNRTTDYMGGLREYVLKKQGDAWLIDSVSATIGTKKRKLTL
jgi:hypothetical protein